MQRSAACPGSVDPRWESGNEFCFAVAIDAPEDINEGCVVVSLRDEQVYVAEAVDASRQEDAIYELGEAVLPFRDLFYRGKAMAGTRTVQLTAQWLQLRRAPGMVRVAGQAFETDIARISGTENLVEDEIPEDRATTPKTPHVFELPNTPVFDIRGLAPSLDLGEMLRTPRRKPSDTTTVSPRAHLQRLRRAANHAEKSLLRSSPLARETMQTSLRDRIRDALVGLRERDSRAASAGALWAELRNADDQRALIFIDEILGLRQTATAGGIASGVLTDELAPVSARRQTLALLAAVAVSHPRACVPRLRAALRTVALASQSGGGPTSVFSLECAQVAGGLARAVFPHAAVARGSCVAGDADFVVGALITPFTLMLSRPRARGRRSVAACVAAVIGASSGPCTVSPGAAAIAAWIEEACRRHTDALEPFFDAAQALIVLYRTAASMSDDAAARNIPKVNDSQQHIMVRVAQTIAAAIAEAAPLFARHAARCIDGEITVGIVNDSVGWRDRVAALELVEMLATSDCCCDATSHLCVPLLEAANRARHDSVRAVREAAHRAVLALEALRTSSKRQQILVVVL
ncbi:hypothetical protein CTAYLR_005032 [Chrysophaeum taylorii]|uniref:Uncharacterized protein n=1 Tax=Chrysophaeum taylorii TaxID=2483200 RepID=A0AAD7UAQ1_9STRA|nr:hypothetical protein CTAYLR_005032 [Chrysophaeum taylorii]